MRLGPGLHLRSAGRPGSLFGASSAGGGAAELVLTATSYDPEQHYCPNQVMSSVMGGQLGSSHSLVFGRDENGQSLYHNQTALAHYVSTTIPAGLVSLTTYEIEARVTAADYTPAADRVLAKVGSHEFRIDTTGALEVTDGTTTATSNATTGVADATEVAFAVRVAGTAVDFEKSTDGGATWSAVGTQVTAGANIPLPGSGTMSAGAQSTTSGFNGRIFWVKWYDDSSVQQAEFLPALFIPGNRGHGAQATDAYGNTWTVTRAGSPLSLIDSGDGNGNQVRFGGVSGNYLGMKDRASLLIQSGDSVQFDWRMSTADWTPSSAMNLFGQYLETGSQRGWRVELTTGGAVTMYASTNGAPGTVSSGTSSAMSLTDGNIYYLRIVWTVGTGFALYTSTDGSTYTIVGSAVSFTAVPFNSTAQLLIGGYNNGTAGMPTLNLYDFSMQVNSAEVAELTAANLNRHRWRIDNIAASAVTGGDWRVVYTDSAEDANDPVWLWHYGDDYVWAYNSTSNNVSQQLDAGIADGSVVSVRVDVAALDWTPAAARRCMDGGFIIELNTNGTIDYQFDGATTTPSATSSVAVPVVDEQRVQIRADHDPTGDTVDFYYRFGSTDLTDDTGWTALGSQQSITDEGFDTTITGGTDVVYLGGSAARWDGKLFGGVVIDDGTVVWSVDPADSSGDGTSWTDSVTGNTVTINRATSGFATAVVKQPCVAFGDNHYIAFPYDAAISEIPLTAATSVRLHQTAAGFDRIVNSQIDATQDGWSLQLNGTSNQVVGRLDDGTTIGTVGNAATNMTTSSRASITAAWANGDQEFYVDGVSKETETVAFGSVDVGGSVTIGARGDATGLLACAEMFSVAVLSKRVTDAEALAIHNELAAT